MVKYIDVLRVVAVLTRSLISCANVDGTQDICGGYNGRRLYLELGSKGFITAQNVSLPYRKTALSNPAQQPYYNGTSHEQCTLELVTCPGCVVNVVFHYLNLSHQCNGVNRVMDSPCHCDYVWLSEPPYEDVSGVPFCGIHNSLPTDGPGILTYKSSTRTLSIVFLYSESHANAFTFEYTTERNRQFLKGYPRESIFPTFKGNISHGGMIRSPFFPALYPRDLGVEYIIACQPDLTVSCRVRILFHDFQIDVASIMEFYDWNGQRLEISTGTAFRPPVILSNGPSLIVRFYANGGTNLGYKATYSFLSGNLLEKNIKPDTDCGGYVENLGGAITMMNMVTDGIKTYDCVWLIRPPKNYLHLKTHLFLKVSTFSDMAGNTELQVLRGLTSEQPVLEKVQHPINQLLPHRHKEHIVPVDVGFYVSLRGTFGPASRLAIIYTTFSYSDCFSGADTLCQNHRCIPSQLFCDGFDHCGDNSDEPSTCYQDWKSDTRDRHWYSHTPNYYFPKMERYPDLKTATLIFIISCLGLILLITALIILLYRMGSRVRNQREIQSHLQTITDLLDGATTEEVSPDEPPTYEAPPDYDDVIKVFISSADTQRRKLLDNSDSGSFAEPSRNDGNSGPASLDISRTPIPENLSVNHGCLALSTSGFMNITANPYTPAITSRSCQTTPIPDSPPPPYCHMDSISVIDGNVYDPTTSLTAVSSPLCVSTTLNHRRSKRKGRRGKKLRNAWIVARDELVRNLQETIASSNEYSSNGSSSSPNTDSNNQLSHSFNNTQQHNSSPNSEMSSCQNRGVNFACQLQNEANHVIDGQNLNSFSDQESCYESMPSNASVNYFSDFSCMNTGDTPDLSWQSNNSTSSVGTLMNVVDASGHTSRTSVGSTPDSCWQSNNPNIYSRMVNSGNESNQNPHDTSDYIWQPCNTKISTEVVNTVGNVSHTQSMNVVDGPHSILQGNDNDLLDNRQVNISINLSGLADSEMTSGHIPCANVTNPSRNVSQNNASDQSNPINTMWQTTNTNISALSNTSGVGNPPNVSSMNPDGFRNPTNEINTSDQIGPQDFTKISSGITDSNTSCMNSDYAMHVSCNDSCEFSDPTCVVENTQVSSGGMNGYNITSNTSSATNHLTLLSPMSMSDASNMKFEENSFEQPTENIIQTKVSGNSSRMIGDGYASSHLSHTNVLTLINGDDDSPNNSQQTNLLNSSGTSNQKLNATDTSNQNSQINSCDLPDNKRQLNNASDCREMLNVNNVSGATDASRLMSCMTAGDTLDQISITNSTDSPDHTLQTNNPSGTVTNASDVPSQSPFSSSSNAPRHVSGVRSNDTQDWPSDSSTIPSRRIIPNRDQFFSSISEEDSAFYCSCEGACGCATAWRNSEGTSRNLEQSDLIRPNDEHQSRRRSGFLKSGISSNLIWISAEGHDFL